MILILNEELYKQSSLLMMSIATVNLVAIDARLTQSKKIVEVDLLKEEYGFNSVQFILNRFDYNPNLLKELIIFVKKVFRNREKQTFTLTDSQLQGNKQIQL
ncbi:MAG: hypothetical protein ACI86M_003680 [Saprospiraceae bacterium]